MSVIYVLIPIAILLTILGIYLFFWAVKTEQFEDLEKQGMSILFDDDKNHSESTHHKAAIESQLDQNDISKNQTQEQDKK
ncbi:MAG: cbb3-type cytochrome oxidase assembly protein CcoS [Cognaticolwellia sp.]